MKLSDVDTNLGAVEATNFQDKDCYVLPDEHFCVHGVYYDEPNGRYARMPYDVALDANEYLAYLSSKTAGGRVKFSTDSVFFGISVTYDELCALENMPMSATGGFALFEELPDGTHRIMGLFRPDVTSANGYSRDVTLYGGKMRDYVLYMPLFNDVKKLTLAFDKGATVTPGGKPYEDVKPILYYGSSITQGISTDRPDNSYQGFICKWNNVDFVALGFSGRAKGEDCIVDHLTTVDCSLFVCDYDHNAPNPEHLEATHLRLYERYRKARPDVPIIFISRPDWDWDPDGRLNPKMREVVKHTYDVARSRGDEKVWFIDGETLFGAEDRESCSTDGTHPNVLGFKRMAEGIIKVMAEVDPIYAKK